MDLFFGNGWIALKLFLTCALFIIIIITVIISGTNLWLNNIVRKFRTICDTFTNIALFTSSVSAHTHTLVPIFFFSFRSLRIHSPIFIYFQLINYCYYYDCYTHSRDKFANGARVKVIWKHSLLLFYLYWRKFCIIPTIKWVTETRKNSILLHSAFYTVKYELIGFIKMPLSLGSLSVTLMCPLFPHEKNYHFISFIFIHVHLLAVNVQVWVCECVLCAGNSSSQKLELKWATRLLFSLPLPSRSHHVVYSHRIE